jgi:CheY-like chemotaxis protein
LDDKATSRELLRTVLEKNGYAIFEAADGGEAIEKARVESLDLILLDL